MEFDFNLRRLLLLAALLGVFATLGGFTAPQPREDFQASRVGKAWLMCIVLFVGGAVATTIIEHTVGHMDPTNLRPAYVFIGVVLMIAGVLWLRTLKQGVESKPGLTLYLRDGSLACPDFALTLSAHVTRRPFSPEHEPSGSHGDLGRDV